MCLQEPVAILYEELTQVNLKKKNSNSKDYMTDPSQKHRKRKHAGAYTRKNIEHH